MGIASHERYIGGYEEKRLSFAATPGLSRPKYG
jgi:hypothetical protein